MGRAEERQARQRGARRAARGRPSGGGKPKRTGIRRFFTWKKLLGAFFGIILLGMGAFVVLYLVIDIPEGNPAATKQSNVYKYSDGTILARDGKVNREIVDLDKVPEGVQQDVRRGREQVLLQGPGRRLQGHGTRADQHRDRQGEAGWLDDHPAVREELLPRPGPDRQPQAEGTGDLAQGGPREEQGRHPRGVHQHQLLRPRRLRHPGRRPGLLRRRRQGPERAAGRLPRGAAPGAEPVRLDVRDADRQEAGQAALELRARQHGRRGLARLRRAGGDDVPEARAAEGGARPRRADRVHREGGRRGRRQPARRAGHVQVRGGGPLQGGRLHRHAEHRPREAEAAREGRRGEAGRQARPREEQGGRPGPGGRRVRRPEDRQGPRHVRRRGLREALHQQRHPPRLPVGLHLQAADPRRGP
ncbi:hypothetical protein SALBM135S_10171 [Streptomyces alboniger]